MPKEPTAETNVLQLDVEKIESYLSDKLPDFSALVEVEKFSHGQSNPTFLLKTAGANYVLRRKPPGVLLKSAHAVDREFKVQSALYNTGVPVPRMYHLCEDENVLGSTFYVMEHIGGRNFIDPRLSDLANNGRAEIFDQMNKVIAALHQVDVDEVGLSEFGAPGNYFERQIKRWSKQYYASETDKISAMDGLIDELNSREAFEDGQRTLVHGDFRIDNLIFAKQNEECLAVLDWELSTLGHPFADLASIIMQWRMQPGDEGRGLAGVDREALGIPTENAFIEKYCERRNISDVGDFGYCLSFCFFRMAAVLQGVKKRALEGNASNPQKALKLGEFVGEFANNGLQALEEKF